MPAGASPGRPVAAARQDADQFSMICPTQALRAQAGRVEVEMDHCVHCQRCRQGADPLPWQEDAAWSHWRDTHAQPFPARFRRSLHVLYVDAGACGACVNEIRLVDAPVYNLHRFGIFITATPRDADVLLVSGPITDAMHRAVVKAYAAMPEPKRVLGMGVCAINGGVFGKSFASHGGLEGVIPVDLWIPGCPPPPLAIIEGLRRLMGWTNGPAEREVR